MVADHEQMARDQEQSTEGLPPWLWPRAAYVHVPFCAYRCAYCDFAIAVGKDYMADRYLEAVAAELATLGDPQPVQSLFIGGGTPSQLTAPQLDRFLRDLGRWLPRQADPEFSLEANPDSLDRDKVNVLADHGCNRLSLGVQSFHPELLQRLGRPHTPEQARRVVELARTRIANVSLDLIFGVPGQTLAEWQADIKQALALEPDHLSIYGLTYEKGTPLWKRRRRGEVQPLDEEAELAQYARAIDLLEEAGFEHYELSNFARPGRCSRHNAIYWANWAYWGFGMGAARYLHGRREMNTRDLHRYLRQTLAGEPATFQVEELPPKERALETLCLGLRRAGGVCLTTFRRQTGFTVEGLAGPTLQQLIALDLVRDKDGHIYLSRPGKYVADSIMAQVLAS